MCIISIKIQAIICFVKPKGITLVLVLEIDVFFFCCRLFVYMYTAFAYISNNFRSVFYKSKSRSTKNSLNKWRKLSIV